ncbi:DUF6161 domain-containing protein [Rhizobium alvei]|uniref:DUF6161 domain-containing protein n=1 Tax=Rhizobium alvei TaxID=1132659 RepID=A0ABT8YKY3_9HYPH|nr:DUF6161 domain-containing protein [Rhizobium alvei]MDO6964384.1 DUF6161 domain-containing protein [Rhizobium alvei]
MDISQYANPLNKLQQLLTGASPGLLNPNNNFEDEFRAEINRMIYAKIEEEVPNLVRSALDQSQIRLAKLDGLVENISQSVSSAQAELSSLENKSSNINQTIINVETDIEGFKNSVLEKLKLEKARKLWTTRSLKFRDSFRNSSIIIAVFLICPIIFIATANFQILQFLNNIEAEMLEVASGKDIAGGLVYVIALGRLVVVTLPIALYIWIIKLLIRYNARTLILLDDSEQRHAMLETYLYLVEQDEGTNSDRAIVLEALFRAMPGHANDGGEPFAIADLLKAAGNQPR